MFYCVFYVVCFGVCIESLRGQGLVVQTTLTAGGTAELTSSTGRTLMTHSRLRRCSGGRRMSRPVDVDGTMTDCLRIVIVNY